MLNQDMTNELVLDWILTTDADGATHLECHWVLAGEAHLSHEESLTWQVTHAA